MFGRRVVEELPALFTACVKTVPQRLAGEGAGGERTAWPALASAWRVKGLGASAPPGRVCLVLTLVCFGAF
jgi:hypothetical protein